MSDNHNEEAHTGPVTNPTQLLWASVASFVVPVFGIIGLVYFVTSDFKPAAGSSNAEKSISERIQKVGAVDIKDANRALKSGEEVYKAQCAACHAAGVAGAPKFGDTGMWGSRLKTGYASLLSSALKGKGAMGAQAGGEFENIEIGKAVVYMANASGGKFPEPQKPAAAPEVKP